MILICLLIVYNKLNLKQQIVKSVYLQLEGVATKKDLEGITHVETSSFALNTNSFALKTEVDKLDIPKLGTLTTDAAKLSNKVANDLVEKTDFNSLKILIIKLIIMKMAMTI